MSMDVFFSQDPWRLLQPLTLALKAIDIQNVAAAYRIGQAGDLPLQGHQTAESAEQGRLEPRLATANICIPLPTGHDNLRASCSPALQTGT